MPGEMGGALDDGNHENGTTFSKKIDDPVVRAQRDQVNVVCPTCGQIPPAPQGLVKTYSGLSASGHSNNVFGDVQNQIIYCCSHCAPHSEHDASSTSVRRTQTNSSAASLPSPTQVPSGTNTLETLPTIDARMVLPVSHGTDTLAFNGCEISAVTGNNGGGIGSATEPTSVSLIGLKSVPKPGTTGSSKWRRVYSTDARAAKLNIQDAYISEDKLRSNHEYPFVPLSRDWASCIVSIEANEQTGFRRLKIEEEDACEVWIPDTRVQVSANQKNVSMRFSNCNKLQPPGYYRTQNGTPMSVTTYHPEKPNVTFEVGFSELDMVDQFRDHILRRDLMDNTSDGLLMQESPQTTIMHHLRHVESVEQRFCVSIWKQLTVMENESPVELHDIVAISDKFDLEVVAVEKEVDITIGYVDRLTYYPAFDQPDLPQNVKRTLDGGPAKQDIEGGHQASSKLRLTTSSADATNLINHVLSKTLSLKLQSVFYQLEVKMSSAQRLKFGSNSFPAQLTLWSEQGGHIIRVLLRTSGTTATDRKSISKETEWYSVTFAQGEDQPTAGLKQNVLTIKKIDCEDGNCLSTSTLRPIISSDKHDVRDDSNNINSIDLELRFNSAEQVQQFREIVTDEFLRVTNG